MSDLSDDSRPTDGNPGATRNRLSCWYLAFEVRLQFQLLPKIQIEAIRLSLTLDLDLKLLISVLTLRRIE
jgi:hypothetical protein